MSSVVISGDTSGSVTLQAPAVAGTTVLSLPNGSGTVVTSTNISSYVPPARGGTSYATLSSGTPNITLTSASDQVQIVTSDASGQSITLPAMTTLTTGAGYFVFYNTSIYPVALKDAGGTIREYLLPSQTGNQTTLSPVQGASLVIEDISTSNGVWHCQNPTAVVAGNFLGYVNSTPTPPTTTAFISNITWIGSNYFLVIATDSSTTLRACLGTLDTTTKVMTFGAFTTVTTAAANQINLRYVCDSNGSDRGIISTSLYFNSTGQGAAYRALGFAVVSGTLYFSAASTWSGVTSGGFGGDNGGGNSCQYAGADSAFLIGSGSIANTSYQLTIRGFTVGVAGTTVTLTAATGTYTTSNTAADYYSISFTSPSTMVMDRNTSTASPAFLSYNTATNAITSGTRTSQTSRIAGSNLLPNVFEFGYDAYWVNAAMKWVFSTSGGKLFTFNYANVVTNPGTATVTVATTTFNIKSFGSKSYITEGAGSLNITSVYIASASVGYAFDSSNNLWYRFDPSNSNLNFNYGSASLGQYLPPNNLNASKGVSTYLFFISSSQVAPLIPNNLGSASATIYADVQTFATPFIS
jgi:hypothetical protein